MTLEAALYSYLSTYAGLTALVGDRIYPMLMPEGVTYPAVVIQRISSPREHSHQGPSGLAHPRFQFTAWSPSTPTATGPVTVKAVVDQIRAALDGYTGTMGGVGGVDVQAAYVEDEIPKYENDTKLFGSDLDVIFWHAE